MTTWQDIVTNSLRASGITGRGIVPASEDSFAAFGKLRQMMAQWNLMRWNAFVVRKYELTLDGSVSYTIGPGGEIDTGDDERPHKILSAFIRQENGTEFVNYDLKIILARQDYELIAVKEIDSLPEYLFLETSFPLGNVFLWPFGSSVYELHLFTSKQLTRPENITDTIILPEGYDMAIENTLAVHLASVAKLPVTQDMKDLAKGARTTLKNANFQPRTLRLDSAITQNINRFNIYKGPAV